MKGGVAAMLVAAEILHELQIPLAGDILFSTVVDEEIGGMGTLAMVDRGYHRSPVEDVLPVALLPTDDRVEKPEGINPTVVNESHFITTGIEKEWPYVLGFNEVKKKESSELLVMLNDSPFLVVGTFGEGRSAAWTSDIGPHWCPKEFVDWPGYGEVWARIIQWLSKSDR
jgi:uncharacterized membrane protein